MILDTTVSRMLGIQHAILQAPMGGVAGARLCEAVSRAGGFGMIGGGYGDKEWVTRELDLLAQYESAKPWGIGFISWALKHRVLDLALSRRPTAIMLSFGDSAKWIPKIKKKGVLAIVQVQSVADARTAHSAGADIIVAQGTEAGGHGGKRTTFTLVPAVADAVAPVPVVAAGGVCDARAVLAARFLGAQGVLIGTRYYASMEALAHPKLKRALTLARGDDTVRTRVFDTARGLKWPAEYTGRALHNSVIERWEKHQNELALAQSDVTKALATGQSSGDPDSTYLWVGEGVDLVDCVLPAAQITSELATKCRAIARAFSHEVHGEPLRLSMSQ